MPDRVETITIEIDGLTLTGALWRAFRDPRPGLLSRVYAANPGLSYGPTILPVGAQISVPISADDDTPQEIETITLWG